MRTTSLTGMGCLGAVLVLFVACSGQVQSLGEKAGGGGGSAQGGSGTGGTALGGTATGGTTGNGEGGLDPASQGGAGTGGTAQGGSATGGSPNDFPGYPLVGGPIAPTCKCADATQICDILNRCVARCDSQGRCAKWLVDRAIKSLFYDGSALFYATARSTDPLGNPDLPVNGALYKITGPTALQPELVLTGLLEPTRILGRYNGSTFITTSTSSENLVASAYGIYEVTDAGVVTSLESAALGHPDMQGHWLVYSDLNSPSNLKGIDLATGRDSVVLAPGSAGTVDFAVVVGDHVLYTRTASGSSRESCVTSLATVGGSTSCSNNTLASTTIQILAADTAQVFALPSVKNVNSYGIGGTQLLALYNDSEVDGVQTTAHANGWLYSQIKGMYFPMTWLVRYPTTVGRLPQEVLPYEWGTPLFAVGKDDIYWTYPQKTANSAHYIFHAPLPPQPCDSGLPCADTTQVCTNGFCAAQ